MSNVCFDCLVFEWEKCVGCEACVDVCPTQAICIEDGHIIWWTSCCICCYACEDVCPVCVFEFC